MRYGFVIDTGKCIGCDACAIACKHGNGTPPGVFWSHVEHEEKGTYPNAFISYTPLLCMHCEVAPCVNNCPTGASIKEENGAVHIDQEKCIGCRQCITACPYRARWYTPTTPEGYYPAKGLTAKEEVDFAGFERGKVTKCTMCRDRVDSGEQPRCVQTCPTDARLFGDLDDPESEVAQLVLNRHATQLSPEYGTNPSVYYL